jgi:hypothetical protein
MGNELVSEEGKQLTGHMIAPKTLFYAPLTIGA